MADGDEVGRVLVALTDGPLEPDPDWSRLDDTDNFVAQVEITAGKQDEFDQTETNKATVHFNDTAGLLDPNTAALPLLGCQIMVQLYNPQAETWHTRFRGIIDQFAFDLVPATIDGVSIKANVAVQCVGIFDYLAGLELIPGVHGDTPPAGSESTVFYEDGEVDDRFITIMADAGIDSTRYVVFSGNVMVQETKYDPGDSALVACRDAGDAETPVALANIYEDRFGRFVFHGRESRLDPDTVAAGAGSATWDFQRYNVGDGAAITGDSTYAQIRPPLQYSLSRSKIVNAALVTPRGVTRSTIPSLVESDATSIASYGVHSYNYSDSINDGHKTNGDTASEDCGRSAEYLVANYKDPLLRVDAVTLKTLAPDDDRAEPTWKVLCRADISDVVTITVGYPGGDGIDADYFVEGFTQVIRPLNPTYDMTELTLNVSPIPVLNTYND